MTHWIYMNGLSGCMPDSCSVYATRADAIDGAQCIFEDSISQRELRSMRTFLRRAGIHYFNAPAEAGAEYCEVSACECGTPWDHEQGLSAEDWRERSADVPIPSIMPADADKLRTVKLAPYGKPSACKPGAEHYGPTFTLVLWDPHARVLDGKDAIGYELREHRAGHTRVLFSGADIGCSPLHAMDSDATLRSVINWLTLKPGDTDAEFFEGYHADQLDFAESDGEALALEVERRFPTA